MLNYQRVLCFFPHIFVWGSCFWFCTPASGPPPPASSYNLPTHNLSTQLAHTQLVHTQLVLTQLLHTQPHTTSPHTTCSHTTSPHTTSPHTTSPHTTCSHTTCHTHNLSTHNLSSHNILTRNLSTHNLSTFTTCPHTSSIFTLRGRRGTWWQPPSVCVAGVALMAWQAWHLATWTSTLRGIFAWQASHLVTSTFTLHGRRGIWRHPPSLCVAGVALGDIHLHFAWQYGTDGTGLALLARLVPRWRRARHGFLRGRRGTWRHPPSLCVVVVALGDIHLHFVWQAWHLVTSTVTLRGTYGTGLAL